MVNNIYGPGSPASVGLQLRAAAQPVTVLLASSVPDVPAVRAFGTSALSDEPNSRTVTLPGSNPRHFSYSVPVRLPAAVDASIVIRAGNLSQPSASKCRTALPEI